MAFLGLNPWQKMRARRHSDVEAAEEFENLPGTQDERYDVDVGDVELVTEEGSLAKRSTPGVESRK
nr:hypothetical protein L203_05489 [Cryptococcus depauperatus CBS 7841]